MTTDVLKTKTPRFDPEVGMTSDAREEVAKSLSTVLANTYMLFIKTQGVHWNVGGSAFYSVHKLTEEHYENMFTAIDEIAERIRALGIKAPASYTRYGELSAIVDRDEVTSAEDMVSMLIEDHATVVRSMRDTIEWCEDKKDFVTADMMIARMAWHEEAIWMLRSLIADS